MAPPKPPASLPASVLAALGLASCILTEDKADDTDTGPVPTDTYTGPCLQPYNYDTYTSPCLTYYTYTYESGDGETGTPHTAVTIDTATGTAHTGTVPVDTGDTAAGGTGATPVDSAAPPPPPTPRRAAAERVLRDDVLPADVAARLKAKLDL